MKAQEKLILNLLANSPEGVDQLPLAEYMESEVVQKVVESSAKAREELNQLIREAKERQTVSDDSLRYWLQDHVVVVGDRAKTLGLSPVNSAA